MPIEISNQFIIQNLNASADRGGWQANGLFVNDQANAVYGRRVELTALVEGGGDWAENYKLVMRGSLIPRNLVVNRRQSQLSVELTTSNVFLASAGLQGIYFTEQSNPQNVHQITNLNLGKIVEHILEQHTNISQDVGGWVDTSGIDTTNSTSVDVYTVRQSNSIWQTIKTIADNEFYVRYMTKDDRFIYERHPQYKSNLPAPVIHLTNAIIGENIEVAYRDDVQVDQLQLYALTDNGVILQSFYPENIGTEGRREKLANIRCNSQSRLDLLAERAYKVRTRNIDAKITLPGFIGGFLELYDRVSITYAGTSINGVTINWSNKKFWVTDIDINMVGNFAAYTVLSLTEENL